MQRRTFFRLTAATAIAPWIPLAGCDTDGVSYGPFDADVRASADGLVFYDAAGRSYTIAPDATEILSADAAGRSLGRVAGNVALSTPKGVCATHDGTRFIVDRGTSRVLRLGDDGRVDMIIGGPDAFAMPSDLDASPDGTIYVADTLNHRIKALDVEGNVLATLGTPGTGEGELNAPRGVACARNAIYVANSGNSNVLVFDRGGDVVGAFEAPAGRFNPTGIALRGANEVLVIDTNECALYVFDAGGSMIERRDARDSAGRRAHPIAISVDPQTGAVLIGALPGAPA